MAEELPSELEDQCSECHKSLAGIERLLKPLMAMNRAQVEEKVSFAVKLLTQIASVHSGVVRGSGCCISSASVDICHELAFLGYAMILCTT